MEGFQVVWDAERNRMCWQLAQGHTARWWQSCESNPATSTSNLTLMEAASCLVTLGLPAPFLSCVSDCGPA